MTGEGNNTGAYLLFVIPDAAFTSLARKCTDLTTDDTVDPFCGCQWHLNNTGQFSGGAMQDINVEEVWEAGNTGAGVSIAVVDDGLYHGHEDLRDNVDTSRNYSYWWHVEGVGEPDEVYEPFFVDHGTAVAGLITAEHNEVGVRGVAPGAQIYSFNYVDFQYESGTDLAAEADATTRHRATTHVSSNSWGPFDNGAPQPSPGVWRTAIKTRLKEGDAGRGLSYVWAGGNGGDPSEANDNSNLDGYANFYGVTAVCAVNHNDTKSLYSEPGANLWVCAPSNGASQPGSATTREGASLGFDGSGRDFRPGLHTDNFGGTSAAAPIVSGVVALIRSANPNLTWRDVKLILAASARKNDATDTGWEQGALQYGSSTDYYSFNHKYGFGVVDAGAAVALAADWSLVPGLRNHEVSIDGPDVAINALNNTYTRTVTVPDSHVDFIEFVEVTTNIEHSSFRDLKIELESPSGATSLLVHSGEVRDFFDRIVRFSHNGGFRFGSAKHLGENPAGEWKLHITDEMAGRDGTLRDFKLKFYGYSRSPGVPKTPSGTSDSDSVTVTWGAPSDAGESAITSYDLRHILSDAADKADSNWTTITSAWTSGALSYDLTGLTLGVRYDIQVRAINSDGTGPWSRILSFAVAIAPGAPANIAPTSRNRGLTVDWDPPTDDGGAGVQRYDIRHIETDATDKADGKWTVWTGAWRTGGGDTRAVITNLTNGVEYDVQVRATNRAASGPWSATTTGEADAVNLDPEFPATESGVRSKGEHDTTFDIGAPVSAIDPDGDPLTYSLAGTHDSRFSIDTSTGQLRRKFSLDYESTNMLFVVVRVSDKRDENDEPDTRIDDSIDVTINVIDQNDRPFIQGPRSRTVLENFDGMLAMYTVQDPEHDSITWRLTGNDAGDFIIGDDDGDAENGEEQDGELRFKTPPTLIPRPITTRRTPTTSP